MKYLKLFEDFNLNDKIPSNEVIDHVMSIHSNVEDFDEGDLLERILRHDYYEYKIMNIEDIDGYDDFQIDYDVVDEYIEMYENGKTDYPPIVLDDNNYIIDGTHRINALIEMGIKTIKALVAI